MKNQTRYIPENSTPIERAGLPAIVYSYTAKTGEPAAIAYQGKSSKKTWHYRFGSAEQREKKIDAFFAMVAEQEDRRLARKIETAAFVHSYKPGDILYSSWGYDQTNIDFYQVVSVTAKTVTVRKIAEDRSTFDSMHGATLPIPGKFISDELITRKVCANTEGGFIKIESYEHAWKFDNHVKYYSETC